MKHLVLPFIFLLSSLVILSCSSSNRTTGGTAGGDAAITTMQAAVEVFTKAVKTNDTQLLTPLFVTPELARIMSPNETKGLSDKAIREQMIDGLKDRFTGNVEKLRTEAKNAGLSTEALQLLEWKEYPSTDPPLVPRVINITLAESGKIGKVPVTYLQYEGRIYFFEILKTTNIFQ